MQDQRIFVLLLFLMLPGLLWCQVDLTKGSEAFPELYHGRVPSPRNEAMGRSGVVLGGDDFSAWYNPAGVSMVRGLDVNFSYASPYYTLENGNYMYLGLAAKFNKVVALGLSTDRFNFGQYIPYVDTSGTQLDSLKPNNNRYTFTLGIEPVEGLHFGLNLNYDLMHQLYTPLNIQERAAGLSFDFGVTYDYKMENRDYVQDLDIGASLTNFTFSQLQYSKVPFTHQIPVVFRVGGAYLLSYKNSRGKRYCNVIDLCATVEYQDVLDYGFQTRASAGVELKFYEIVALRAGYYAISQNTALIPINDTWNGKLTYGIGLECPLHKLTGGDTPLDIKLDCSILPQLTNDPNVGRFFSIGTGINYYWF